MKDEKHLISAEMDKLSSATEGDRNVARERCPLLLMFRHCLRVSEASALTVVQMDTESRMLYVARLNKGLSATHLLHRDEIKVISAKIKAETDVFFVSERRTALSPKRVWATILYYCELGGLPTLGTGTFGTVIYTAANPARLKDFGVKRGRQ